MSIVRLEAGTKEPGYVESALDEWRLEERSERDEHAMTESIQETVEFLRLAEAVVDEHMPGVNVTPELISSVAILLERRYAARSK